MIKHTADDLKRDTSIFFNTEKYGEVLVAYDSLHSVSYIHYDKKNLDNFHKASGRVDMFNIDTVIKHILLEKALLIKKRACNLYIKRNQ